LFGRETGYNRGKGGSMHIADLSLGLAQRHRSCGSANRRRRRVGV
jgi:TPP-dependent pyruvate/acetoin dehydrogenase alpha subunit